MNNRFSKCMKKIIAAALVLTLVGGAYVIPPAAGLASASITAKATGDEGEDLGTFVYELSDDGVLTIQSGTYYNANFAMDYDQRSAVKKIVAESGVVIKGYYGDFSSFSEVEEMDLEGADFSGMTSMNQFFGGLSKLTTVKLGEFDTSSVTSMYHMFDDCSSLTAVAFGSKTAADNLTSMSGMFYGCSALKSVSFGDHFNTSKVSDMGNLFNGCYALESIDFGNAFVLGDTNITCMFQDCRSLKAVDLSGFTSSSIRSVAYMFNGCTSLESVDLSGFTFENCWNYRYAFAGCQSLKSVTFGTGLPAYAVNTEIGMNNMFEGCSSLETIDMSAFDMSRVSGMSSMFSGCSKLKNLTLPSTAIGTQYLSLTGAFNGCFSLEKLDLSHFNAPYSKSGMFTDCGVKELTLGSAFSVDTSMYLNNIRTRGDMTVSYQGWYVKDGDPDTIVSGSGEYATLSAGKTYCLKYQELTDTAYEVEGDTLTLTKGAFDADKLSKLFAYLNKSTTIRHLVVSSSDVTFPADASNLFRNCYDLVSIDLSEADLSGITNMSRMFEYCGKLETIHFGNADFSQVTDMSYMFNGCGSLTTLDLSKASFSRLENMSGMFSGCEKLTAVDFGHADFSKVTDMSHMFNGCAALESSPVAGKNTASVENMSYMFNDCRSLQDTSLSTMVTTSVTNMEFMFSGCNSLTAVTLNGPDLTKVERMDSMFYRCEKLETVNMGSGLTLTALQSMNSMFADTPIRHIDMSKFDTSAVTSMASLFSGCSELEEVTFGGRFVTTKVTDLGNMFRDCSSLHTLDLSTFDMTAAKEADTNGYGYANDMFADAKLETLTISGTMDIGEKCSLRNLGSSAEDQIRLLGWSKQGSTDIVSGSEQNAVLSGAGTYVLHTEEMKWSYDEDNERTVTLISGTYDSDAIRDVFSNAWNLCQGPTDSYYEPAVGNVVIEDGVAFTGNCSAMFDFVQYDRYDYKVEFKGHITTEGITDMSYMFSGTYGSAKVVGLDLADFDTSKVTDMSGLFRGMEMDTIDISSFDTSKVQDMSSMFENAKAKHIILGDNFNTSSVYNMANMFSGCSNLTSLDLSKFNTSHVGVIPEGASSYYSEEVGMSGMFSGCSSLTTLDVSKFDTSNVTGMKNMFSGCSGLTSIDLSTFNTRNVKSMKEMFSGCSSATEILLNPDFTIESIESDHMEGMFTGCSALEQIDLSSFTTNGAGEDYSKVNSLSEMFMDCASLRKIDLSKMDMNGVYNMSKAFSGCRSLEELILPDVYDDNDFTSSYYFEDLFKDCLYLSKLTVKAGAKFAECDMLENKNTLYGGWHKSGSEDIVSGTGLYAEFTAEGEENEFVTYERDMVDAANVTVKGASLTLEGQIGLNFYVVFPKELSAPDSGAYAVIKTPSAQEKILLKDAAFDRNNGFKFTCRLAAKQIHDQVTISVYNSSNELQALYAENAQGEAQAVDQNVFGYTIVDYIHTVQNGGDTYTDELKDLVNALEAYGSYAQLYFKYRTSTVKTDELKVDVSSITADDLNNNRFNKPYNGYPDGLVFKGYSLVLESETTMKFYFESDNITKYIKESSLPSNARLVHVADNTYCVECSNIPAKKLYQDIEIDMITGDFDSEYPDVSSIYCSPLAYVYSALAQFGSSNDVNMLNLCNTMRALKLYSDAANMYFEND